MTAEMRIAADNWNHNGSETLPLRVLTVSATWPGAGFETGPGWIISRQPVDIIRARGAGDADCLMLESGDLAAFSVDDVERIGLPLVLALPAGADAASALLADRADGFVFADDDAATMAGVFARAAARERGFTVRDLSDGTARTINALSAEAGRIADALARLAEAQRSAAVAEQPVDAALVRRLLRIRRDRDRYFPGEIFADPAWDMLFDLAAAQLEGKPVPVSSLCIAAAVPTTTALRWIRSLSEAGLFERRVDPTDARRTYINLSAEAASAMLGYLRGFAAQFSPR